MKRALKARRTASTIINILSMGKGTKALVTKMIEPKRAIMNSLLVLFTFPAFLIQQFPDLKKFDIISYPRLLLIKTLPYIDYHFDQLRASHKGGVVGKLCSRKGAFLRDIKSKRKKDNRRKNEKPFRFFRCFPSELFRREETTV